MSLPLLEPFDWYPSSSETVQTLDQGRFCWIFATHSFFLPTQQTPQIWSQLKVFAHAVPFSWISLPFDLSMAGFFSASRSGMNATFPKRPPLACKSLSLALAHIALWKLFFAQHHLQSAYLCVFNKLTTSLPWGTGTWHHHVPSPWCGTWHVSSFWSNGCGWNPYHLQDTVLGPVVARDSE